MQESPPTARTRPGIRTILVLTLLVLGVAVAAVWANLWKSDLRVREISVEGNSIVGADEIRSLAKIPVGAGLFTVDLYAVRRRVEANGFIRSASVNRDAPDRITIAVEERVPVATLAVGTLLHLDEEGYVLPSAVSERLFDLPVITGIPNQQAPVPGRQVSGPRLREALRILVLALRLDDEAYRRISEVNLRGDDDIVLYTAESAVPVLFGRGDEARKLVKFDAFWREFMEHHEAGELAYVDLRFDDQVVVRWNRPGQARAGNSIEKEQTWTTSL